MSEYAPGHTIGSAAELDKKRIKQALEGKLLAGEDENGFIYESAPKKECDRFILDAFDNMVYQCRQLAAAGRALERILYERFDLEPDQYFHLYMQYVSEEERKYRNYISECEMDDFMQDCGLGES